MNILSFVFGYILRTNDIHILGFFFTNIWHIYISCKTFVFAFNRHFFMNIICIRWKILTWILSVLGLQNPIHSHLSQDSKYKVTRYFVLDWRVDLNSVEPTHISGYWIFSPRFFYLAIDSYKMTRFTCCPSNQTR